MYPTTVGQPIGFLPLTMASDCEKYRVAASHFTTSKADLRRTVLKFSSTVLPYVPSGWNESGNAVLSSNNQIMTIKSKGWCATTYFDRGSNLEGVDDHLIKVTF